MLIFCWQKTKKKSNKYKQIQCKNWKKKKKILLAKKHLAVQKKTSLTSYEELS